MFDFGTMQFCTFWLLLGIFFAKEAFGTNTSTFGSPSPTEPKPRSNTTRPVPVTIATTTTTTTATTTAPTRPPKATFLPFGKQYGDRNVVSGDDISTCFRVSKEFPLFTFKEKGSLCISSNGYIMIDGSTTTTSIPIPNQKNVLVPYNEDMVSNGQNIFFRTSKNRSILDLVDRDVAYGNYPPFKATEAIVITFNNVAFYNRPQKVKFQAILATNYKKTFVIFNYLRLDLDARVTGFSDQEACNSFRKFSNRRNLVSTTNVGVPGKHVHLLTNPLDCANKNVMYPYGRDTDQVYAAAYSRRLVSLKVSMPLFSRPRKSLTIITKGYLSIDPNSDPLPNYPNRHTYVAPYFGENNRVTVFYRETNNASILERINEDVRNSNESANFQATHAFLTTFLSANRRFQLVLGTDGKETIGVFNYQKLNSDSGYDIGMNEVSCGKRTFHPRSNSHLRLIKGNNTGVRGRFVHLLSSPGCFKQISGLRIIEEEILKQSLSFYSVRKELKLFGENEVGSVVLYVKEIINSKDVPTAINIISLRVEPNTKNFFSHYGIFYGGDLRNRLSANNLFILKGTSKSRSFQFGTSTFNYVESGIKCRKMYFDQEMDSAPVMKITAVITSDFIPNFVNVWLRHISSTSFTFCTKEMTDFSGRRNVKINYVAFTKNSEQIQKAYHIPIRTSNSGLSNGTRGIRCTVQRFKEVYLKTPSVFTSVEDVEQASAPVIGWTKTVSRKSVEVCIKSISNTTYTIHLLVKGQIDPCNNFTCPGHLECRLSGSLTPYCDCIKTCAKHKPFCGSDFHDYESVCLMNKDYCHKYGNASKTSVVVKHYGKCQIKPMQSGRTELDAVSKFPGLFCKYVHLEKQSFITTSSSKMKVLLTVSWNQSTPPKKKLHDASAVWSEKLSTKGFRACVIVTGRHSLSDFKDGAPHVYWQAFQEEFFYPTPDVRVGSLAMNTWYTGTQCKNITTTETAITNPLFNVYASVEHSEAKDYKNAMTVWSEITLSRSGRRVVRVCARELQNFDGIHKGIIIHWIMLSSVKKIPYQTFMPEQLEVTFPQKQMKLGQENPARCQTVSYNLNFPSLPNPTVLIGGINRRSQTNVEDDPSVYSNHDISVWIENISDAKLTVCLKSLRTSLHQPKINVGIMTVANLCKDGGNFFRGNCYKTMATCEPFKRAEAHCVLKHSTLPIVKSKEESIFLQERVTSAWLDLQRPNETHWAWGDESDLEFTNWYPGQPPAVVRPNHDCVVMDNRGIHTGWRLEHCSSCQTTICQKDANLDMRMCDSYCLNGGDCSKRNSTVHCVCPDGFHGKRCQNDVSKIEGCSNYTMHNESWRNINTNSSAIQPNSTSCDAQFLREGWHRFTGPAGTKLYTRCPNSKNRCGTASPGWVAGGSYPSELGQSSSLTMHFYSFYCADDTGKVEVKNCGAFYTYRFLKIPYWSCKYGLCTI